MPRQAPELSALVVSRLILPGRYRVGGVSGLCLQVSSASSRCWIFRTSLGGRRSDLGLGSYPGVTLASARTSARECMDKMRRGIDPMAEREAARTALIAARAPLLTFGRATEQYLDDHEGSWKNAKHYAQWVNTLKKYALPLLEAMPVKDISTPHILQVLEPIWRSKTETASRVRGRLESILDWCAVRGYREGANPARWQGHLDQLLPAPAKVAKVEHHEAMDYRQIARFLLDLHRMEGTGAKALEFCVLTAARSGEVRGASWGEIDRASGVWIIPAARMKAEKEHRIPLSPGALRVLDSVPRLEGSDLIFPGSKGTPLSDMTLSACLRRMGLTCTVHGFRSTFRDWAGETTAHPREVVEHALAHQLKNKVEAAYARGDLLAKRKILMDAWAAYCEGTL